VGRGADEDGEPAPSPEVKPGAISALLQEIAGASEAEPDGGWEPALRPGAVVGRFELVRVLDPLRADPRFEKIRRRVKA
jgi:hypothetical protein